MIEQSPDKLLNALRNIPFWLLLGLAVASFGLLFFPGLGSVDPAHVRKIWGGYFWCAAILFSTLAVAKAVAQIAEFAKSKSTTPSLAIVPVRPRCAWRTVETEKGFYTQLELLLRVTNLRSEQTRLLDFQVVSPRKWRSARTTNLYVSDVTEDSYDPMRVVQSRQTASVSCSFLIEGTYGKSGKSLTAVVAICDQFGSKTKHSVVFQPPASR